MRELSWPAHAQPASDLIVWLPGAYQRPEDFVEAGFATSVAARGLPIDLVFVDLEMRHLGDREGLEHLCAQVLHPAERAGTPKVWLAGISLGGYIALDLAARAGVSWHGLCLFAPYLGNRMMLDEIRGDGGVGTWQPEALAEGDDERGIWRFIKSLTGDENNIYLGYGRDDRFAAAHALLADCLPSASVDIVSGGHDWPTWSQLWQNFLTARFP